jgi:hypothetical protein
MKNFILLIIIYLLLNTSTLKAQWIEQTLPGDVDVTLGIDFINKNNGILGGWHYDLVNNIWGNAFYTTDAGTNWIEAYIPIDMRVMVDVQLLDNNYGYGVGAYNLTGTNQRQNNTSYSHNLHAVVKKYYENLGMHFDGLEEYRGCFIETTNGGLVW